MPQIGDEAPAPRELYGDPPVDVGPLYVPTDEYVVQSIHQLNRHPPDGRMIPTMEVEFVVPGVPNLYNRWIDNYAFSHGQAPVAYIYDRAVAIRAIWEIP